MRKKSGILVFTLSKQRLYLGKTKALFTLNRGSVFRKNRTSVFLMEVLFVLVLTKLRFYGSIWFKVLIPLLSEKREG